MSDRNQWWNESCVSWVVEVNRGVLGKSVISPFFKTQQEAKDWLAQFGDIDGRVSWR